MGDLGSWLRGLGLAKYQALLEKNEIDLEVLPELDEADLEKLGIPMGPRKKLLRAIAELPAAAGLLPVPSASSEPAPLLSVPPHLANRVLRSRAALEGERRQVTILFADVAGSTDLVQHLGAEQASDLLGHAVGRMADAVHSFEGTVNKVDGDGLMAIFGAPLALEDHATRACRAALAMQQVLSVEDAGDADRHDDLAGVRIRVGLHSGEVVVRAVNNDLSINYDAIGLTVHLAARMEQTAPAGRVRLTAETRRLASGYIEANAVGPVEVKGLAKPVEVFELTGITQARGRLEATASRGLTPLVGRMPELAVLEERLARVREGHGQVVFVIGEAGIGKSRLLHEFRARIGDTAAWLEGRTLSFGRNMAFHPVRDLLQRAIGIEENDSPAVIADKVERHVQRVDAGLAPIVPYILHLLGADPGDTEVARMDPQLRRAETFDALRRLLLRAAARKPQVVVVEDLHWADSATEEFLATIAADAPAGRILFLFTYRPGYPNPFGERTFHTRLILTPLPADATTDMARTLLGTAELPEAVRALIVGKAEGNPFFVEEIVGSLREIGALRRGEDGRLVVGMVDPDVLPDTIQDVIMARIDRIPAAARATLQLASVIGRDFTRRLVDRLDEIRERTEASLRELKAIELIHEKSLFPELAYMFKHALTQDVAYHSLLERRRKELHRLVGEAIEILYAERIAEQYDVLAYHFAKAEEWPRALRYFRLAAERAGEALATREAIALYDQALEAAARLGAAVDPRTLIAIREDRANLFGIVSDFRRAQEEGEAWLEVARGIGDKESEAAAQVVIGLMAIQAHDFARALDRAERTLEIAKQVGSAQLLAQGHHLIGYVKSLSGELDIADTHFDKSLAIGASSGEELVRAQTLVMKSFVRYWQGDFAASRRLNRAALAASPKNSQMLALLLGRWLDALALIGLGRYDEALPVLQKDLETATKVGAEIIVHRITNTFGWLHLECGDARLAYEHNARCLELAGPRGDPETVANAKLNLADLLLLRGDRSPARQLLEEVHRVVHDPATSEWMRWRYSTHMFGSLATLALAESDVARAEGFANECLELATRSRAKKYLAVGWRLRGEIASAGRRLEEAEAHLRSALAFAKPLRNPTQLWKTQLSLGEVLAETGRHDASYRAFRAARSLIDRLTADLRTPTLKAGAEGSPLFQQAYQRDLPGG